MIAGAAVLPTAPLLLPGVSATMPDGIPKVCDAIDAVVEALPTSDVIVLVAAGEPAVYDSAVASLQGIGRPDITVDVRTAAEEAERLAGATGLPLRTVDGPLPLDLAVLALHVGDVAALVPVSIAADADFQELASIGDDIAYAFLDDALRVSVIVAGDLSAGLTEKSPLHLVSGAIFFDEQAVAAVDGGRLHGLAKLGPDEALRVGARAWAPLGVLHGVLERTKLGLVVRHYSAPRGVGYLVASGG